MVSCPLLVRLLVNDRFFHPTFRSACSDALVVPIPLMLLGLFTSAIQALVFATLAGAYIGEAVEEHH